MRKEYDNRSRWLLMMLCGVPLLAAAQRPHEAGHPAPSEAMEQVRQVHGGAGPFAVAGFRMGQRALAELKLKRGGFDFEVTHEAPAEVQWSCIVDGLQAATGASLGKLNLRMVRIESPTGLRSTITDRENGRAVTFRLRESFVRRFLNVPRERLEGAGEEVLKLSDDEIFEMEVGKVAGAAKARAN